MSLRTSVVHPVKAHVYCTCVALLYCGVDDSTCCGVIREDRGGRLGVAHLGLQFVSLASHRGLPKNVA
eukprot:13007709-Ditylum_brightwellii.AAC.1